VATTITMPQLGETVTEGTVAQWLKKPGDSVEKYEAFVEVSTDKVNAEVPSPVTGIIRELIVKEGETVPTGAPIAIIDDVAAETTPAPNGSASPSEQVAATTAEANHQASDEPVPGGNVGLGGPSFSAPSNGSPPQTVSARRRRCGVSRANITSPSRAFAARATTAASPRTTSSRRPKPARARASRPQLAPTTPNTRLPPLREPSRRR